MRQLASIALISTLGFAVMGISTCKGKGDAPAQEAKAPVAFDSAPAIGTQATCPVTGETFTVKEDTLRSEHGGKHYAFCCPACKPQFDADPGKYVK